MELFLNQLKKYDIGTYFHSLRVADLSFKISQQITSLNTDRKNIYYGGLLHDIGKLKVNRLDLYIKRYNEVKNQSYL